MATQPGVVFAYIDETGDRGTGPRSSEWFAITAALVAQEDDRVMQGIVGAARHQIVGTTGALHWSTHCTARRSRRRDDVVYLIQHAPALVIGVAVHKPCLRSAALAGNGSMFYNFAYKYLLERIAFTARDWPGGGRFAKIRADSVKGMDHADTLSYLSRMRANQYGRVSVPWGNIQWPPTWHDSGSYDGLQLADVYAGTLGLALNRQQPDWLLPWQHRFRSAGSSAVWRHGLKVSTGCHSSCLLQHDWAQQLQTH